MKSTIKHSILKTWEALLIEAESGFLAREATPSCPFSSIFNQTSPEGITPYGHKGVSILHMSVRKGFLPYYLKEDDLNADWGIVSEDGWSIRDAWKDFLTEQDALYTGQEE
jgi:hypothetical protein